MTPDGNLPEKGSGPPQNPSATREAVFKKKRTIRSSSLAETIRIGKRIGRYLKAGDVVALTGELGAGKTHLIKGIAAGTGIKGAHRVTSPTFTLLQTYPGKVFFYHVDFFRLNLSEEAEALGLEDVLGKNGITAIEWADKFPSWLPEDHLAIHLDYLGPHDRSLSFRGRGRRGGQLLREIFPDPALPDLGPPEDRCLQVNRSSRCAPPEGSTPFKPITSRRDIRDGTGGTEVRGNIRRRH